MSCGEPLDSCPECETAKANGSRFCPHCGRPLVKPENTSDVLGTIAMIATAIVSILMVLEVVTLVAGISSVWTYCADHGANILLLLPRLTVVGTLEGLPLQIFWILIVVAILLSVYHLIRQTLPALRAEPEERFERIKDTPLFWTATLLCVALFLNVVIMVFQLDAVTGTDSVVTPGFEPDTLYSCANAAVWEEIITRVVYIGVPLTIIAAVLRRRDCLRFLLGGFGMSRLALVLIVISAVVFGFGHYDHWGLWKVLPTMISGIAMGYLYVRFGIHASITFHFIVDYMATMTVGPMAAVMSIALILILVLGIPCLIRILKGFGHAREDILGMNNLLPEPQDSRLFRRD